MTSLYIGGHKVEKGWNTGQDQYGGWFWEKGGLDKAWNDIKSAHIIAKGIGAIAGVAGGIAGAVGGPVGSAVLGATSAAGTDYALEQAGLGYQYQSQPVVNGLWGVNALGPVTYLTVKL